MTKRLYEINKKQINSSAWMYLFAFLGCLALKIISLFGVFNMNFTNSGSIFLPVVLAGRDWSDFIQEVPYYGWGYYVLFTPLFVATKNPYVIYSVICFMNIVVIGLTGVLIYHIISTYFHIAHRGLALTLTLLCSTYVDVSSWEYTNETPALVSIWIITWCLIKSYQSCNIRKHQMIYTILLVLSLAWAYSVHTRLLILWLAVAVGVILFYWLMKKWIVHPHVFLIGSLGGVGLVEVLKQVVTKFIWSVDSSGELHNASLIEVEHLKRISFGFKIILDIIISNLYKITIETYGIFLLCLIVGLIMFWKLIREIKWKKQDLELTTADEVSNVVLIILGIALLATLCALPVNYGTSIARAYAENIQNSGYRGFTYIRYYYIYFGPILVSVIVLLKNHLEWFHGKIRAIAGIFTGLAIYIWLLVLPHIGNSYFYGKFIYGFFVTNDTERSNYGITISIVLLLLGIYIILLEKKYIQVGLYGVLGITILCNWNMENSKLFLLQGPSQGGEGIYSILSSAEGNIELPSEVYVPTDYDSLKAVQFMLNDYQVKYCFPDEETSEAIIYTSVSSTINMNEFIKWDYQPYFLNNKECIWIKGKTLQDSLEPYIETYVKSKKTISADELTYTNNAIRAFGIVTQKHEGDMAYYVISTPMDGRYEVDISMEVMHSRTDALGTMEIWVENNRVGEYAISEEALNQSGSLHYEFESNNSDDVTFKLILHENIVVRNIEIEYACLDDIKKFGINHEQELSEIATVIRNINLELPLYLVAQWNCYNKNSDFSHAEEILDYKIIDTIDVTTVSDFRKNGFVLLENDVSNSILFDAVQNYTIIYHTQQYTLMLFDNFANRKAIAEMNIQPLSQNGMISIDYFRMSGSELLNGVWNRLEPGIYKVEIITDEKNWNENIIQVDIINNQVSYVNMNNRKAVFYLDKTTQTRFDVHEYYTGQEREYDVYITKELYAFKSGDILSFSDINQEYYASNFYGVEEWGRWSSTTENQIYFKTTSNEDVVFTLNLISLLNQQIHVYTKGLEIGTFEISPSGTECTITIPKDYLEEDGIVELTILAEETWIVDDMMHNGDMRSIGIGVQFIEFQ